MSKPSTACLRESRLRLTLAKEDVVVLGGMLLGYEGLVALQGETRPADAGPAPHTITLVTTADRLAELREVLDDLAGEVAFTIQVEAPSEAQ